MNMLGNLFGNTESSVTNTPEDSKTPEDSMSTESEPVGLDKWKNLVHNEDNSGKNKDTPEPFDPVAILQNPETLAKITGDIDFTQSISSETQQKLNDNDPGAMTAMINDIGKATFVKALQYSSAMTQQHIKDVLVKQESSVSDRVKSQLGDYELEQKIPKINNPIVRLGTQSFLEKLTAQNPTMSSTEKAEQIKGFLKELTNTVNPTIPTPVDPKDKEIDWMEEMGLTN